MKSFLWCAVVLLAGVSAAGADEGKLTPERAKKLLPEAASVPYKDLEALSEGKKLPKANQSPTYFVLTFVPPKELPEGAAKDFDWSLPVNPAKFAAALTLSRDRGFASILQEKYITQCTCESDDRRAQGQIAFKCDAYTGSINFKAAKVKGGWVIREFEWPHLGVRFVRGEGGNWRQEKVKR
jgi:hypothetical protein